MKKTLTTILAIAFVFVASGLGQAPRPSDLKYPPLNTPARSEGLPDGLRQRAARLRPGRPLPALVNITAHINFGAPDVPKDKQGSRSS